MEKHQKQNNKMPELEFRWHETHRGQSVLQVKNIQVLGKVIDSFETLYFNTNAESILGENLYSASVLNDYVFSTEIQLDEYVNIKLSRPTRNADTLSVYVNDKPTCIAYSSDNNLPSNFTDSDVYPVVFNNLSPFVTTWKVPSDDFNLELPLSEFGSYHFFVDWGDGKTDIIKSHNSELKFHRYETKGEYIISIEGRFAGIRFSNNSSSSLIYNVVNWGCLDLTASSKINCMFDGCNNLTISATDAPRINQKTSFHKCFRNCSSLVGGLSNWNVSMVTDFSYMFISATKFNENLSTWCMESANTIEGMFSYCESFNSDVSNWNTSNLRNISRAFYGAKSFNRTLANWNVETVENFSEVLCKTKCSVSNYSKMLCAWSDQRLKDITADSNKLSCGRCEYSNDAKLSRDIVESYIGINDGGLSRSYTLNPTLYVTVAKIKSNLLGSETKHNIESWCELKTGLPNAFIIPITEYDKKMIRFFKNSYTNETCMNDSFLLMDILKNKDETNFNMNHKWKVKSGMTKLLNHKVSKWESITTIENINEQQLLDGPGNMFILNLSEYQVTDISSSASSKPPASTDYLHIFEIDTHGKTIKKQSHIGFQDSESEYCYFNDLSLPSDIGYDPNNKSYDATVGNFLLRNSEQVNFLIFSCISTDAEYAKNNTDTYLDCMISYKVKDTWSHPDTLCNLITDLKNIQIRSKISSVVMEESIGFHFNDQLKMLSITLQSESSTRVVILKYSNEKNQFEMFTSVLFSESINKTFKLLDNYDLMVCVQTSFISKFDCNTKTYSSVLVKSNSSKSIVNKSCSTEVERVIGSVNVKNEHIGRTIKVLSTNGTFNELVFKQNVSAPNSHNSRTLKKVISNKNGDCIYSNIFGEKLSSRLDWGITSSGDEHKVYYFNKSSSYDTSNKDESCPVIIETKKSANLFSFPMERILQSTWVDNYLVLIELAHSDVPSASKSSYYFNNLYLRVLHIDDKETIRIKEVIRKTKMKEIVGDSSLLKIINRFIKLSVVKGGAFGSNDERLVSITSDPSSDKLVFAIA